MVDVDRRHGSFSALPSEAGGMPVWPWVLGVLVLIGGGVSAALTLGR